ncbi:MAG: phytanoyl-CoA hydroxylase [Candidatus Latescibacterota bacterium]|jgi:phytanoyl-CoA hydroxylase
MKLNAEHVEFFHREGYLVVENALSASALDALSTDFDLRIAEVAQRLYDEGHIQDLCAESPFDKRIALLTQQAGVSLQGDISFPNNLSHAVYDFLHNPELLDLIEALIGPEIFCNPTQHVRPKLPEALLPKSFDHWIQQSPFHQDAAVLLPEADDTLVVTSWIPLVDADANNGTLHVFPRLHHGEILRHVRCPYGWMVDPELLPSQEPVILPVRKGSLILLHGRTPHGSLPNGSDSVRWSLDLRWNDARKACGRPLPGMLVRSRQQQTTSHTAWVEAWAAAKADTAPRTFYRWETV